MKKWQPEDIALLKRYLEDGKSSEEISSLLNTTYASVERKKHSLGLRSNYHKNYIKNIESKLGISFIDFLKEEYINKKRSMQSIAQELDMSSRFVENQLKVLNISKRGLQQSSNIRFNKPDELQLTLLQEQLLLGSMLGDGAIQKYKDSENAFFLETHGEKQWHYLGAKSLILKNCLPKFYSDKRKSPSSDRVLCVQRFYTMKHKLFNDYWKMFYNSERKKIITRGTIEKLDVPALAVWYMDDGTLQIDNDIRLYTMGFSTNECHLLIDKLRSFNIVANIKFEYKESTQKSYPYLVLSKKDSNRFLNLTKGWCLPSMEYKFRGYIENMNGNYWNINKLDIESECPSMGWNMTSFDYADLKEDKEDKE